MMGDRLTAIVAEDEAPQRAELLQFLGELWPDLNILAVCEDGAQALAAIGSLAPDVAFLDIRMPEMNGIDVARAAGGGTHVIFITAYDDFAVQAFDDGALDYLLKPVSRERLSKTISRVTARVAAGTASDAPSAGELLTARMSEQSQPQLRWITAGVGTSVRLIPIEDVLFFQAQDKYTRVVTAKDESYIRTPLKDLLPRLDPNLFWQVHRSAIVCVTAVSALRRTDDGGHVVSIAGTTETLPVTAVHARRFKMM